MEDFQVRGKTSLADEQDKVFFKFKRVTLPGETQAQVPSDLEMSMMLTLNMDKADVLFVAWSSVECGFIPELNMHVLWLSHSPLPRMFYGLLGTCFIVWGNTVVCCWHLASAGFVLELLVIRFMFQNLLAIVPNEFAKDAFGGQLPALPKIATKKFVTDENNKKSKVCFAADLKLATCDPPYARKFRTAFLGSQSHNLDRCSILRPQDQGQQGTCGDHFRIGRQVAGDE